MSNGNKRQQTAMTRTVTDATRARVLDLLEAGESLAAIAREAGVNRKTARAIRGTLEGQERVARGLDERARHTEAQRAARARAHQVICEAIERAAEVLRDELDGPDRAARLRGDALAPRLGVPVIVENKPGGTGALAFDLIAKSPPDGYTLTVGFVAVVLGQALVGQQAGGGMGRSGRVHGGRLSPPKIRSMSAHNKPEAPKPANFLRGIIERDLEAGTHASRPWGGRTAASRSPISASTKPSRSPALSA